MVDGDVDRSMAGSTIWITIWITKKKPGPGTTRFTGPSNRRPVICTFGRSVAPVSDPACWRTGDRESGVSRHNPRGNNHG